MLKASWGKQEKPSNEKRKHLGQDLCLWSHCYVVRLKKNKRTKYPKQILLKMKENSENSNEPARYTMAFTLLRVTAVQGGGCGGGGVCVRMG